MAQKMVEIQVFSRGIDVGVGGSSGGSCADGGDGLGGNASISALFICIGGDDAMDNEIGVCLLVIF